MFTLEKLTQNLGQFSSTALVLDTFNVKYCSVLEIELNFGEIFLILGKHKKSV